MKIIVIDDDTDYQEIIGMYLQAEGFTVIPASSGADGIELVKKHDPSLVILDVSMPHMDGWETCARLRKFSNVPMIMMSAVAKAENDTIRALNTGADDYLIKPITPSLLKAYIHALLRRTTDITRKQHSPAYIDSYLQIDLYRQEVRVNTELVALSLLEYRLLELLVENAHDVISSLEIAETLWGEDNIDHYLDYVRIYIGRIRRHIEPDPSNPIYILNIYGLGYRFTPQS